MSKNQLRVDGRYIQVPVAAGTLSGDPQVSGQIAGVAVEDRDASGNTVLDRRGTYNLSVKGIDQVGNSAVAVGDILYYFTGDTPPISKKNTGVRFGYALGTVGSSLTATIEVLLGF